MTTKEHELLTFKCRGRGLEGRHLGSLALWGSGGSSGGPKLPGIRSGSRTHASNHLVGSHLPSTTRQRYPGRSPSGPHRTLVSLRATTYPLYRLPHSTSTNNTLHPSVLSEPLPNKGDFLSVNLSDIARLSPSLFKSVFVPMVHPP